MITGITATQKGQKERAELYRVDEGKLDANGAGMKNELRVSYSRCASCLQCITLEIQNNNARKVSEFTAH